MFSFDMIVFSCFFIHIRLVKISNEYPRSSLDRFIFVFFANTAISFFHYIMYKLYWFSLFWYFDTSRRWYTGVKIWLFDWLVTVLVVWFGCVTNFMKKKNTLKAFNGLQWNMAPTCSLKLSDTFSSCSIFSLQSYLLLFIGWCWFLESCRGWGCILVIFIVSLS